jgi:hypothetical protein
VTSNTGHSLIRNKAFAFSKIRYLVCNTIVFCCNGSDSFIGEIERLSRLIMKSGSVMSHGIAVALRADFDSTFPTQFARCNDMSTRPCIRSFVMELYVLSAWSMA